MTHTELSPARRISDNGISVDCVIFGFDGERLNVLLLRRTGEIGGISFDDMKLPGSPIYQDEDLDEAAHRVLKELTGLSNVYLSQFKAFGSKTRTENPRDVIWLEKESGIKVDRRMVTVAYIALLKIGRSISRELNGSRAIWVPLGTEGSLAFDHNQILAESISQIRRMVSLSPDCIFDLLPRKFTISQLRKLYETILQEKIDAGNFYKKLSVMPYVVPLDEKETGTPHRAARLYRFDRVIYRKNHSE